MCGRAHSRMFFIVVVGAMSLLAAGPIQGHVLSQVSGDGRGYFALGASLLDIKALKTQLENSGYSTFEDWFISVGGGGYGIINGVLLGGEGHGLIGNESGLPSGTYKTSLSGGYGLFNIGYLVYSMDGLNVYPFLGLGGGVLRLKIVERGAPSFEEVLGDPRRSAELSTGGLLVSAAFGADYLLNLKGNGEGQRGVVLGLRVGYAFTPLKGDWKMDEMDVSGGPRIGLTGPYIQFMFGGGGTGRVR